MAFVLLLIPIIIMLLLGAGILSQKNYERENSNLYETPYTGFNNKMFTGDRLLLVKMFFSTLLFISALQYLEGLYSTNYNLFSFIILSSVILIPLLIICKRQMSKNEFNSCKALADQRDSLSQINLGLLYRKGKGVKKNDSKAAEYYKKAADNGNAIGLCNLAFLYEWGEGVEKNIDRAIELYQKSTDLGDNTALLNLARIYEFGFHVPKDYSIAAQYYQKAADNQDPIAQYCLAEFYLEGQGVEKNVTIAKDLLLLSSQQMNAPLNKIRQLKFADSTAN